MTLTRDDYIIQSIAWKIREVHGGDSRIDDNYGKCDFANHIIWICADGPPEERLETLIHETCHALANGLTRVDLTHEDELRVFSVMLTDTLLRNNLLIA